MAIDTSVVHLDFEVLNTNTCKALKILDLAHWASAEDDAAYIQIVTPGQVTPVTHIFQKGKVNIFNTVNLNISGIVDYSSLGPLPDGMYKITLLQCENDPLAVTKYHLQDCQIRCRIARKLITVDLNCDPCRKGLLEEIQDIMLFLDGAQAQTDKCNVNKAMEYYRRAALLLERISDTPTNPGCLNC